MTDLTIPAESRHLLSGRRRRELGRQATARLEVGPALHAVLAPGEQILAGTLGSTGRWQRQERLAALVVVLAEWLYDAPFHPLGRLSAGLPLQLAFLAPMIILLAHSAMSARHHKVFLALTDCQLICVRPTTLGRMARVRFRVPRELARVRGGPRGRRASSVTYFGPGAKARGLRITVAGAWRHDLDDLVAGLQAAGVPVDGYLPGGRPASEAVHQP
jgi:hypothetical protein